MVAGNGGSAADSEHIVGELMKRFKIPRPIHEALASRIIEVDNTRGPKLASELEAGLPAVALTSHLALSTAVVNDTDGELTFAQQLISLGRSGDAFLGISTSGNSKNVVNAAVVARALNISVLALTGDDGGELASFADVAVRVPETETYMIQELHLPIYHAWCLMLEDRFFGSDSESADMFLDGEISKKEGPKLVSMF